jgi:hypothetical protein
VTRTLIDHESRAGNGKSDCVGNVPAIALNPKTRLTPLLIIHGDFEIASISGPVIPATMGVVGHRPIPGRAGHGPPKIR